MRKEPANGPLWEDLGMPFRAVMIGARRPGLRAGGDVLINFDGLFAFASALARTVVLLAGHGGLANLESRGRTYDD
jgi:hypothetical protein